MSIARVCLATLAGICTAQAFSPNRWYLAIVGLAIFSWALDGQPRRLRVLSSCGFALGLYGMLMQWITIVGYAAGAALLALCVVPWLLFTLFKPHSSHVVTAFRLASIITLIEAVRSSVPWGGFPWGLLAFSQVDGPLMPASRLGGEVLTTFVVVVCGYTLFAAISQRSLALPFVALGIVIVPYVTLRTPVSDSQIQVSVIQGSVPREGLNVIEQADRVFANHIAKTRDLAKDVRSGSVPQPDLVIWPENAADGDPVNNKVMFDQVQDVVNEINAPVLIGAAVSDGPIGPYNAGLLWLPNEGPDQRYEKRHLVPFGEYIPHRNVLKKYAAQFGVPLNGFIPGQDDGIFTYKKLKFADVICFEVADDIFITEGVEGGANFITVQSNNATYAFSQQPVQQLQITRFRAFEHSRSIAVATTTGFSALIDQDGAVLAQTREMQATSLTTSLAQSTARQPIDRWGSGPWLLLAGIVVVAGVRGRSPWRITGS